MATATLPDRAAAVLTFWFGPDYAAPTPPGFWPAAEQAKIWFRGGPEIDEVIKRDFAADVDKLAAGAFEDWQQQPMSTLAGIILADQFTRNIHRNTAAAFALDPKALDWSKQLRARPDLDQVLPSHMRYFSFMPLMHSEDLRDQEELVQLFRHELEASAAADPDSAASRAWANVLSYAVAHRDVVARWGRFPHRNALLGRDSTPEEAAGLADGSIPRW